MVPVGRFDAYNIGLLFYKGSLYRRRGFGKRKLPHKRPLLLFCRPVHFLLLRYEKGGVVGDFDYDIRNI